MMYQSNINLNLYKTFYEVALHGSITEAVKKTYTSQPAISKSIKKLEEELQTTLFYRSQSGITLTPQGEELFYYIKKAYHNLLIAKRSFLERENLQRGKLSIGVPSQIGTFYLFEDIAKFHELYPNIEITIISKSTTQLLTLLETHEIDFMIDTSPIFTTRSDMIIKPLSVINNCFVAHKNFQYSRPITSLKQLADIPLILPIPGTSNRNELDEVFEMNQIDIHNVFHIHTSEMIIGAIKRNLGIGYVIEDLVKDDIKRGELEKLNIIEKLPTITINLVYIKNYLTEAPKFFIEHYIKTKL